MNNPEVVQDCQDNLLGNDPAPPSSARDFLLTGAGSTTLVNGASGTDALPPNLLHGQITVTPELATPTQLLALADMGCLGSLFRKRKKRAD